MRGKEKSKRQNEKSKKNLKRVVSAQGEDSVLAIKVERQRQQEEQRQNRKHGHGHFPAPAWRQMHRIGVQRIGRLENSGHCHKFVERRIPNIGMNLQPRAALGENKSVRGWRRDFGFDESGHALAGIFFRVGDNLRQLRIGAGMMRPKTNQC